MRVVVLSVIAFECRLSGAGSSFWVRSNVVIYLNGDHVVFDQVISKG